MPNKISFSRNCRAFRALSTFGAYLVVLLALTPSLPTAAAASTFRTSPTACAPMRTEATKRMEAPLSEDFENGTKTAYTAANVQLSSGSWYFNNALIGTLETDHKAGAKSVRIRNNGSIRMNFDYPGGASTVTLQYASYGSDAGSTWELQVSTDGGNTYTTTGNAVSNSSATLQTARFTINIAGNIRLAIVKTDETTNRLNVDAVQIEPYNGAGGSGTGGSGSTGTTLADDDNMLMGNPSNATADTDNYDNYLMLKTDYTLSYSRDEGKPNWVSWHVHASDLGPEGRSNDFRADSTLPAGWFEIDQNGYKNSGFDRGHNCPSGDRTATPETNSETFLMTNMMPQAPKNNRQTWKNLESYERLLVTQGNEVYIIAGSYGKGGTGQNGAKTSLDNGHITVPSNTWKVIVVLTDGTNDLSRVTTSTRVIAVIMPNINTLDTDWKKYRTSVRAIELATGYNLLSNVPPAIQQVIENKVDNQ